MKIWPLSPAVCLFSAALSMGCLNEPDPDDSLEEIQVAEPLAQETGEALRQQIQTIQAVTEVSDGSPEPSPSELEPLATNRDELEQQCVTALKEVAFCTNDDRFLDIVGVASSLRTPEQRERFMERVHFWFEPGGARVDCRGIIGDDDPSTPEVQRMWQRAATATDRICADFGEELIHVDALRRLAHLWASEE
jgi:hypothetical protein